MEQPFLLTLAGGMCLVQICRIVAVGGFPRQCRSKLLLHCTNSHQSPQLQSPPSFFLPNTCLAETHCCVSILVNTVHLWSHTSMMIRLRRGCKICRKEEKNEISFTLTKNNCIWPKTAKPFQQTPTLPNYLISYVLHPSLSH